MSHPVELFPGFVARGGAGTVPHDVVGSISGLEFLQRIIQGDYPVPPMGRHLGFGLSEVAEGRAVFRGMPSAAYLNPLGVVHGGWAATLLDSALGCAVHTLLQAGEGYSTVEFKINLTRPITANTGEVVAEGRVLHKGRTTAVSEASLKDSTGKLLAIGTETCSIFPITQLAPR